MTTLKQRLQTVRAAEEKKSSEFDDAK